ncbi:MAG: coproporphyrinogen dehydrogenase HemZ [Oscillospiraceae bacterium]|nr:coproporphyrinogen dehydrogenase HemZ [Oscillospiraceae bacterium]
MTIILNNNTYKYETEATVKLFIPAVRFEFLSDERNSDGDIIMTRIKHCRKNVYYYAYIRENGRVMRSSCSTPAESFDEKDGEFIICRLLFLLLCRFYNTKPQWGLLTGIRPVRKINVMLENGMNEEQVRKEFTGKYFVSEKKTDIAWRTAMVQHPLLPEFDKKTVSIYISIPFCPTRCSYCSFVSHSMDSAYKLIPDYLEYLCRELEILGGIVDEYGLKIDTVYYGGGTPTSISAEELGKIMRKTAECFDLSKVREYNVEAGRADTITEEKLAVIKEMGATRISVNPQTLNNDVLHVIGRKGTAEEVLEAFALARKLGFDNINMDLIAGLPTDTFESFKDTLDRIIALDPDGITVHALTLKRSAGLYQTGHENISNPATRMADYAVSELISHGYDPYYMYRQKNTIDGLENIGYAKPGKGSLYNIFIMDETQTILGAGCAASTKLVDVNNSISRVMNYKFPYEYIRRFDELMKKKDEIRNFFE